MLIKQVSKQPHLLKKINIAIFQNLDLRNYYVEVDGQRYPRYSVLINYEENGYIQQNKDLTFF